MLVNWSLQWLKWGAPKKLGWLRMCHKSDKYGMTLLWQDVKIYLILFYPIFLAKSDFVLFFGNSPILSYFLAILPLIIVFYSPFITIISHKDIPWIFLALLCSASKYFLSIILLQSKFWTLLIAWCPIKYINVGENQLFSWEKSYFCPFFWRKILFLSYLLGLQCPIFPFFWPVLLLDTLLWWSTTHCFGYFPQPHGSRASSIPIFSYFSGSILIFLFFPIFSGSIPMFWPFWL